MLRSDPVRRVRRVPLAIAVGALLSAPVVAAVASAEPGSRNPAAAPAAATAPPASVDRYIVVLKAGPDPAAVANEHAALGARPDLVYRAALRGYAATMPATVAARIAADARVAYVERDQVVEAFAQTLPSGVDRISAPDTNGVAASTTIDGVDDQRVDVDVAVIDSGIDDTHPDLNVAGKVDCAGGGPFGSSCVAGGLDGNGHGTHVAGTIGALDNGISVVGVAPGARLWAVRVLNNRGSGYMSWIAAGIDWVTGKGGIEVANMSLGCQCFSQAVHDAIQSSIAAGTTYVVAAGNDAMDASGFFPANEPNVLTVSALADFDGTSGGGAAPTCRADQDDTLADFSNYGPTVEVAAPGVCILSTWPGGGYNTISGTSMAAPHVTGAVALLRSGDRMDEPGARAFVTAHGNFGWTDTSGDLVTEPLLDISAAAFAPSTVDGPDAGGGTTTTSTTTTSTTTSTTSTTTSTVPNGPAPSATIDVAVCDLPGSSVTCSFQGSSSSASAALAWDFGNNQIASGVAADTTYTSPGTYTVTLTASDDFGSGTDTATVSCGWSGKAKGKNRTLACTPTI